MQTCIGDVAGVFIFEFDEAAFRAAIADRLPFFWRHLFERFGFPEWFGHIGRFLSEPVPSGQSAQGAVSASDEENAIAAFARA